METSQNYINLTEVLWASLHPCRQLCQCLWAPLVARKHFLSFKIFLKCPSDPMAQKAIGRNTQEQDWKAKEKSTKLHCFSRCLGRVHLLGSLCPPHRKPTHSWRRPFLPTRRTHHFVGCPVRAENGSTTEHVPECLAWRATWLWKTQHRAQGDDSNCGQCH